MRHLFIATYLIWLWFSIGVENPINITENGSPLLSHWSRQMKCLAKLIVAANYTVTQESEAIRNGSIITWAHFNLHGGGDFSDERMVDSMGLALPKNQGVASFVDTE
jgi:hypothetical protein